MCTSLLTITEKEPTPVLEDFDTFIHYMVEHSPGLTKVNQFIRRKDLYQLNQKMKTHSILDATPRIDQPSYPLLHLFHHLSFAGKLFQKSFEKSRTSLKPTERIQMYEELTPEEKYFFLLETLWVDSNWEKLQGKDLGRAPSPNIVSYVMEFIGEQQPGEKVQTRKRSGYKGFTDFGEMVYNWEYFLIYFTFFGIWQFTQVIDEDTSRRDFRAESITPTAFGVTIAPMLSEARELARWNLPYRRKTLNEWKIIPGAALPTEGVHIFYKRSEYIKLKEDIEIDTEEEGAPFFLAFVQLVPEGQLQKTLPREKFEFVDGTYVFKVALGKNLWRRIEMSADDTLLELHYVIQKAYSFDADHLYSFFMDGKAWSGEKFTCPFEDEGPHVDEARIGELGLRAGQSILYLFDYGDEWRFQVELEEIRKEEPKPREPKVIEKKGKAPEQYRYY